MASGRTLWDEMIVHYNRGVDAVAAMRRTWAGLSAYVDAERYAQVAAFLEMQQNDAKWWRDASIAYFQTFSKRPVPRGFPAPEHTLDEYESLCIPFVPGHPDKPDACH